MAEPQRGQHAHHFEDADQQREAGELGMWVFLVTEFMFFGGLFLGYLVYRYWYPHGFAEASRTMDVLLGTVNTAVLLTSSFTMALAVHAAHASQCRQLVRLLLMTCGLGGIFLVIKGYEYHHKYAEHLVPFMSDFVAPGLHREGAMTFLNFYFVMTGLHALHMVIGIGVMLALVWLARRGTVLGPDRTSVHNAGLYWHFVDLVWVFLFPFFYLVAASGGAR